MPRSRVLRVALPVLLILIWLAGAGIGGPYFSKVSEVATNDSATFLPTSAEATVVGDRYLDFVGDSTLPAIVLFSSDQALTEETLAKLADAAASLTEIEGIDEVSPLIPSEDGLAAQAFAAVDANGAIAKIVGEVRAQLADAVPAGVTKHVTGPGGFTADITKAFGGIDGLLLVVALVVVLVILLVVYRSLVLPFAVLMTSTFALCVALLVNWWFARAGLVTLTGRARASCELHPRHRRRHRLLAPLHRPLRRRTQAPRVEGRRHEGGDQGVVEPIVASGGTVIAGLLCLLLSDLKSNSTLGPVASIGIVFAMLSALTLLPSMLYLMGRASYWPRRPRFDPSRGDEAQMHQGIYAKAAELVSRRPRVVWVVCALLLALGAAFVPTLKADGVPPSEFVLGRSGPRRPEGTVGALPRRLRHPGPGPDR